MEKHDRRRFKAWHWMMMIGRQAVAGCLGSVFGVTGTWGWHGKLRVSSCFGVRLKRNSVAVPGSSSWGGQARGDGIGSSGFHLVLRYGFNQRVNIAVPGSSSWGGQHSKKKDKRHFELSSTRKYTTPRAFHGEKEAFITATEHGDAEQVRKILEEHKIGPNTTVTREGYGRSALSLAATYGQTYVLAELLKEGADPMLKSATHRTPLHDACIGGHLDCVALLLDVMENVEAPDKNGQTAAHLAAFNGEAGALSLLLEHALESVVCLVERDCDTTVGDNNSSYLAAHLAARHDKLDCLKFLVQQGTAMDTAMTDGRACSHIAALFGAVNALHWLLENGADVNLTDHYGNTPTHYAAEGGKADCFNCCLQHDADLRISNVKGDNPLDTAKKNGHPLLMDRAVKNEVTCPLCFAKYEKEEYDRAHAPAPVERSITTAGSYAYTSPLPVLKTPMSSLLGAPAQRHTNTHPKNLFKSDLQKKKPSRKLPNRDLPTKYFGEYLDPNEVFKFKL
ncbi:ankyrin-3 [Elysia marginata]|uniref:Ankyrin-3 n=1 Tax=Elysia marginata TaxID=1093978 RepID=A0AAV4HW47_9GAST|nr:ankyrin-3 [Elysia marginata]